MLKPKRRIWAAFSALILVALSPPNPFARLPGSNKPPGFFLVLSAPGTELYRKDYQDGYPDFVQVVHLDQGAAVKLLHGHIVEPGTGQGVYGGDNPSFSRQALPDAWMDFASSNPDAFCMTNGQFFASHEDPTQLTFLLKIDGKIVSDGYGIHEYPNQKLMLEIWGKRANIGPLSKDTVVASAAPDIVTGLSESAAGTHPNKPTGRTFVGIDDSNHDGKYEIILIFSSKLARKTEAGEVLRGFGADKVMMLDGGSSAQLICQGVTYVSAARKVPQTIAVVSSPSRTDQARRQRCSGSYRWPDSRALPCTSESGS